MEKKNFQNGEKQKKKKLWIVLVILAVIAISAALGSGDDTNTDQPEESGTQTTQQAEPNTTAKVDELAREAKAEAADGFTEEQRDEVVSFIVENYPNYYEGNDLMEQAIKYGYLLEYAYKDDAATADYAELGADLVQSVKYVYRGAESVLDDSTRENLTQIRDTLEKLGFQVD